MIKNMTDVLNIETCRISREQGKTWLYCVFELPLEYGVVGIQLSPYVFINGVEQNYDPITFDSADLSTQFVDGKTNTIMIPISDLSDQMSLYGIYQLRITVKDRNTTETSISEIWVSDVEFMYHCLIPSILNLNNDCVGISDDVIRKYLLLYGHQSAVQLKDFPTAKYLYKKMIESCGQKCNPSNYCNCHD